MKRRRLLPIALAFAIAPLAASVESPLRPYPAPPVAHRLGTLMQVSVVDRASGRELPLYRHRGAYWVAGRPDARYAIRVRHRGGERLMAVMSVDGINIVTGESAGVLQNGYVFSGGERSDIAGWRKSDSQIAAFAFTSVGASYASRTGRPDDVGVIGVAMFRERMPHPPAEPVVPQARAADSAAEAAMPGASANGGLARQAAPAPSLGTGHGRREASHVGRTTFERARPSPDEVVRIRYDSRENLVAAGIIPVPLPPWTRPEGPSAFPGSEAGYVPDPPPPLH
jgi:hypothetical protein